MRIHSQKDFVSGLLFIAIGGGFAAIAQSYRLGSAASMGPGWFPFAVGLVLAAIGLAVLLGSTRPGEGEAAALEPWDLRGLVTVLLSATLFGILVQTAGLVLAVAAATVLASLAMAGGGWRAVAINLAATLTLSTVVFVLLLGLAIPLLPELGD